MGKLYSIFDLEGYAKEMRNTAAKSLKEDYAENLDEYISLEQVYNIVAKESVGLDDEDRYILDEESNDRIFETIKVWIYNCGLAKLAGNDMIECAWDNECNEMVFWIKNINNPSDTTTNNHDTTSKKSTRTKRKNT